jgi:hypothetical protein
MPSVIGGGRGDVEEVLAIGRLLHRAGFPVQVFRSRPMPLLDDRSYDWSGTKRTRRPARRAPRAVTISSQFGITAADGRDEPLGRAGPWAVERAEIEHAYGPGSVLHLSLEEFARARPAAVLAEERWRESGTPERVRRARRRSGAFRREVAQFVRLYRRFRALDQPNLLAVFPTFRRSTRFAAEFPETVQTGPIWPEPVARRPTGARTGSLRVLWYASPSTSDRLAPRLLAGLAGSPRSVLLYVRSPRPLSLVSTGRVRVRPVTPRSATDWRRVWGTTDLAIVTGTRSLLEAIEWGVPFLYFNGVMGRGRATRRHRPEKLRALLAVLRGSAEVVRLRRDLADFSRLRRVEAIVGRWSRPTVSVGAGVRRSVVGGFPLGFDDGGTFVRTVVDRFAQGTMTAPELVGAVRRESRRAPTRSVGRPSKV